MIWMWAGFMLLVVGMLALDLGVFHRTNHAVGTKEALIWTGVWIALALLFSLFIYFSYEHHWAGLGLDFDEVAGGPTDGSEATIKYLTGYVLEKSLSVDNIFVISMIFTAFAIPAEYQHRVLLWGVIGAIFMRAVMILVGAEIIEEHHWVIYVFGVILIATGIKMLTFKSAPSRPADNLVVKLARKLFPVTDSLDGSAFLTRLESGAWALTPLAMALIAVEATDLLFAVDSVPAIFAVTSDPFIVFTSNIFAMLGLRSLYFALAGLVQKFRYLKTSLAIVLAVVGIKMLAANWLKATFGESVQIWLLAVVLLIVFAGVAASWIADRRALPRRDP